MGSECWETKTRDEGQKMGEMEFEKEKRNLKWGEKGRGRRGRVALLSIKKPRKLLFSRLEVSVWW